ncbi:MAG: pilin [Vibrio sp.]
MKKRSHSNLILFSGFTLIELMIVVSVIGVLASIAIPQYQNYVKKAELSAGLASLTSLKISLEDHIASRGNFPENWQEEELGTKTDLGKLEAKVLKSESPQSGILSLTYGTNSPFNGQYIRLHRESKGAWQCETNIEETKILPRGCIIPLK